MAAAETTSKPPFHVRLRTFFQEVQVEMGKVTWPTWENLKTYTSVVLVTTAIVSIMLFAWDLALSQAIKLLFTVAA